MTQPLLETKLYIPRIATRVLDRPGLLARLEQGRQGKLTLISAPAGFGKTTLLSQWLREQEVGVAWLTLDEGDNDPTRFAAYLAAALNRVGVEIDLSLLNSLLSPGSFEPGAIGTTLVNQILKSRQDLVLVFDDYHHINNRDVHALVAFLLENGPQGLHLVIATRADPPLPTARLRASGEMIEIRADDLRLALDGMETYLKDLHGLTLSEEEKQKLHTRTEGWLAGLQLACQALRSASEPQAFIAQFTGSHAYITEYLTDEVFSGLPPGVQDFLLATCLLDRFCADLCDSVRDRQDSHEILMALKESNSFLASLDEANTWFRYHRLFAEMLQQRIGSNTPLNAKAIYERASAWFEKQGLTTEAIEYALRAKSFDKALALLEGIVEHLVSRGEIDTILAWAEEAPPAIVRRHPLLVMILAWIHLIRLEDPTLPDAMLKDLKPADDAMMGKYHAIQSVNAVFTHADPSGAEEYARQSLAMLPEQDAFFHTMALWNLSAACYLQGKNAEGQEALLQTVESARRSGNLLLAVTALCRMGSVAMQAGDLPEARRIFEEALKMTRDEEGYVLPAAFAAKLGLAKIYREWNQPDAALKHLHDSLQKSSAWNDSYTIEAYDTLAFIQEMAGDHQAARESLERARVLAEGTEATRLDDTYIASQQALMNLRQGNVERVAVWASRRAFERELGGGGEAERSLGKRVIRTFELMVFARFLLGEKRASDAQLILEGLKVEDTEIVPMGKRIEFALLQALVHSELGQIRLAHEWLQSGLELAQPGGYLRPFLEEGEPLYNLLEEHKKHPSTLAFQAQVLEAFSTLGPGVSAGKPDLVEALTGREAEVLDYLQSDLTVLEIAEELMIAESTVRTHIKSLYSKLNVHSRHEAITRARDLSLL